MNETGTAKFNLLL